MRRASFFLGLLVAVATLPGCPPPYPKCNNDEACKEHNEVCVQGQCKECATDQNCKSGFMCQENRCVPKPECTPEEGCGPGKRCEGGKCVVHECDADADCPNGGKCRENRCMPAGSCSTNDDCPTGEDCQAGLCAPKVEKPCPLSPVRFGFNEHSLTGEAQQQLAELAECMKEKGFSLTLEGHADERGTEEYNLHLSNLRASAVKAYLTDLGAAATGLRTVGYGENRPLERGHGEDAWAANRRVEFNKE